MRGPFGADGGEEEHALVVGKLDRDDVEADDRALAVLAGPDAADLAGGTETVVALVVLADDAGEADAVEGFGFGLCGAHDLDPFVSFSIGLDHPAMREPDRGAQSRIVMPYTDFWSGPGIDDRAKPVAGGVRDKRVG